MTSINFLKSTVEIDPVNCGVPSTGEAGTVTLVGASAYANKDDAITAHNNTNPKLSFPIA